MNKKSTFTLLVIFVVLLLIVFLKQTVDFNGGDMPFKDINFLSVSISNPQAGQINLNFKNNNWVFSDSFPVKNKLAETMKNELKRLNLKDLISTNPERFKEFNVTGSDGITVKVTGEENQKLIFYLGRINSSRTGSYFRFKDSSSTYLAGGLSRYLYVNPTKKFWKDPYPLKRYINDAKEIKFKDKNNEFTIRKSTSSKFIKIRNLLQNLEITGIAPENYNKTEESASLLIEYIIPDEPAKTYELKRLKERALLNMPSVPVSYEIPASGVDNIIKTVFKEEN